MGRRCVFYPLPEPDFQRLHPFTPSCLCLAWRTAPDDAGAEDIMPFDYSLTSSVDRSASKVVQMPIHSSIATGCRCEPETRLWQLSGVASAHSAAGRKETRGKTRASPCGFPIRRHRTAGLAHGLRACRSPTDAPVTAAGVEHYQNRSTRYTATGRRLNPQMEIRDEVEATTSCDTSHEIPILTLPTTFPCPPRRKSFKNPRDHGRHWRG